MTKVSPRLALAGVIAALVLIAAPNVVAKGDSAAKKHGPIAWTESFAAGSKAARKSSRIMMVDFWAEWCAPCKAMLRTTYQDKSVVERSKKLVPVLIDLDKNKDLGKKFAIGAIPVVLFLDSNGKELIRAEGFQSAKNLLKLMDAAEKRAKA